MLRASRCALGATVTTSASACSSTLPLPRTPFDALGLSPPKSLRHYTAADIKAAYKKTALRVHPDVAGGSQRHFVLAQAALKILEANPNDVTSWSGSKEFPGFIAPFPQPAPKAAPTASAASTRGAAAYGTTARRPSSSEFSEPGPNANRYADWADNDVNGGKYGRDTAYSDHVPRSAHDPSNPPRPPPRQGVKIPYVRRHWFNEAACYYYAAREGRLRQFMDDEAARKRDAAAAESDVKRRMRQAQAAGMTSPDVCMIWGEQKPIFGEGYANIVEFVTMFNLSFASAIGYFGIALYFYGSYCYWKLPM